MQTVSMMRTPSSRATIAAGTSPPRMIAITAWNGPTSFSRQVSARQSRWNWSHETGNAFPARSCALSSGFSVIALSPALFGSPDHVQSRQHLLDRGHRGSELFGVARADHEIGVRLLVLTDERIAAHYGVLMRVGAVAQQTPAVAYPPSASHPYHHPTP